MLNDMKKRHQLENQKTIHFLKYALGNRAPVPAPKKIYLDKSTFSTTSVYAGRVTKMSIENESPKKLPFLSNQKYSTGLYQ